MTISTTTNAVTALGNGGTTNFAYSFLIPAAENLYVTYTDANGVATVLDQSLYTVVGLGVATGGYVTYPLIGSPIATGTTLTIQRIMQLTQLVSIGDQGNFYPQSVEDGLDTLELQIQQLESELVTFQATITVSTVTATVSTILTSNGPGVPPSYQSLPYDLPMFWQGAPLTAAEVYPIYAPNRNLTLPQSLSGSRFVIDPSTLPTATMTFSLYKNTTASHIGSVMFSTGGTPSVTFTQSITFSNTTTFFIAAPTNADTSGGNVSMTFGFLLGWQGIPP